MVKGGTRVLDPSRTMVVILIFYIKFKLIWLFLLFYYKYHSDNHDRRPRPNRGLHQPDGAEQIFIGHYRRREPRRNTEPQRAHSQNKECMVLMHQSKVNRELWDEAVRTAYLINKSPTKTLNNTIPAEL